MLVSVAICTWNRCEQLRGALERMTEVVIPPGAGWEVLVVNNGCADATDGVIASFEGRLPIRRLFEPTLGLSHARNRAVREARGEYIAWTDDDALVERDWLAEYALAFRRWPEAAFFGGPILPLFEGTPPRWLRATMAELSSCYSGLDFGEEARPLTGESLPYGANFAVRRREQSRHFYDPELGRKGDSMRFGEETALLRAVVQAGGHGRWVPKAKVSHRVPRRRQTVRWLRGRFFGEGHLSGQFLEDTGERKILGRPCALWKRALSEEMRYQVHRWTEGPEVWMRDLYSASFQWGVLRSWNARGARRGPP